MLLFRQTRIITRKRHLPWFALILIVIAAAETGYVYYYWSADNAPLCDEASVLTQMRSFLVRLARNDMARTVEITEIREVDARSDGREIIMRQCEAEVLMDFTTIPLSYEIEEDNDSGQYHVVLKSP
jgi:hypothetical protein